MHSKKSALAAAAALAVGLGSAGTAAANVYAGSGLNLDNLNILITPDGQHVTINNFNFTTTNTATLDGSSVIDSNNCSGTPGAPGGGTNNCSGSTPRLDTQPANAPGGTVARTNNSFTFFGPGAADEFANSDTVIQTAELTGDAATDTNQIAETQLQTGSSASANAEIQSTTGFTFDFTLADNGTLVLSFLADPDLFAAINEATDGAFNTQANVNSSFTLSQNTNGSGSVNWNPQGTTDNDCLASAGLTCTEDNDTQDLNNNVGTTSNHTNDQYSWDPNTASTTPFGITIAGLTAGDWTLTLNSVTSTSITRNVGPAVVPEPGTLLLLGAGLAAVGFASRRKQRV